MVCQIEGCELKPFARGWCSKHYTRWQRHGDPLTITRREPLPADAPIRECGRCRKRKPADQFGLRSNGKPRGYCRDCTREYDEEYGKTAGGRERKRAARTKWSADNHGYFLQYRYNITSDDYAALLIAQGGCCAICGVASPGTRRKVFCVDHCHTTGKVRGLLCAHCNMGLGQFKDDPVRLAAAIEYLARTT